MQSDPWADALLLPNMTESADDMSTLADSACCGLCCVWPLPFAFIFFSTAYKPIAPVPAPAKNAVGIGMGSSFDCDQNVVFKMGNMGNSGIM